MTRIGLRGIHLGDPARGLGVYRDRPPELRFVLEARVARARRLRFAVTDYFGEQVAAGTVTVPAGRASASVALPDLPPGHYRVTAAGVTGCFARLPERRPPVENGASASTRTPSRSCRRPGWTSSPRR